MPSPKERFIVDARGRRIEVILPFDRYEEMLAQIEELDEIRAYDAAKASGEKPVAFKRSA